MPGSRRGGAGGEPAGEGRPSGRADVGGELALVATRTGAKATSGACGASDARITESSPRESRPQCGREIERRRRCLSALGRFARPRRRLARGRDGARDRSASHSPRGASDRRAREGPVARFVRSRGCRSPFRHRRVDRRVVSPGGRVPPRRRRPPRRSPRCSRRRRAETSRPFASSSSTPTRTRASPRARGTRAATHRLHVAARREHWPVVSWLVGPGGANPEARTPAALEPHGRRPDSRDLRDVFAAILAGAPRYCPIGRAAVASSRNHTSAERR